jgi:DNA polymerase-4/DNA polymerase IV (DinB-like DNA polymerase)
VAYSKTAAKTASEEKKPDGYFEIPSAEDFVNLIIDRKAGVLYTVGSKTEEKLNRIGIFTVRDIQERKEDVIRQFGKQGKWITQLAFGIDNRKVTPYRPEDAKSVSREITFQEDVNNYDLLDDVLVLLAISVERRAQRTGLHAGGVTLKLTYADMKNITRSRLVISADSAAVIYQEASKLLEQVEHDPVRLIGAGVYNLTPDAGRQMVLDDFMEDAAEERQQLIERRLKEMQARYGLDFAANLEKIYTNDILHRTVEYMRKHYQR